MNLELRALQLVISALETAGVRYCVGGSFASSAWGKARFTNDFDLVVLLCESQKGAFLSALGPGFSYSDVDIQRAIDDESEYPNAQLIHVESMHRFDLFVVRDSEYTQSVFKRSRPVETEAGRVLVESPETIIIEKLRWYELGNRVSDKQWNDILHVIQSQGQGLDLGYLSQWSDRFGVRELLEQALEQGQLG